jgi:DNA mismatch repair protein MutS
VVSDPVGGVGTMDATEAPEGTLGPEGAVGPQGAVAPEGAALAAVSVLWDVLPAGPLPPLDPLAAETLADLRLDQVVDAVLTGRNDQVPGSDLRAVFEHPLDRISAIEYRQAVCQDLERAEVAAVVRDFRAAMETVRRQLDWARASHYRHESERWFLDAAATYCRAVATLADGLVEVQPHSQGLRRISAAVDAYRTSAAFRSLVDDVERALDGLRRVRYRLHISGNRIRVGRDRGEPDYGAEILAAFEKFRQGATKEYRFDVGRGSAMNHVEAAIVERVARLHPEVFATVDAVLAAHPEFVEPTIARFDAEVAFYLAYLDHIGRLRARGLPFSYPTVEADGRRLAARDLFDLALADRLVAGGERVVTNDVELEGGERIIVVSGPNQGGKTTLARAIGQLHYLAALGLPVPGRDVRVPLVDRIFTHFERQEEVTTLEGKLERDLRRFREILARITSRSLVIMNESFSATSATDALFLNRAMLQTMVERGTLVVCVTFLDELAAFDPTVVSMVAEVDRNDPTIRTYRVVRRPADGRAYATALAEKHGLTYEQVRTALAEREDGHR